MANQQQQNAGAGSLSPEQVEMMKVLIDQMKKPYVDEQAEARKERQRQQLRAQRIASEKQIKAMQDSCNHLRDDGTSRVAWADNFHVAIQRFVHEGFCQLCNKHFAPGVEGYEQIVRVPSKVGMIG